MFRSKAGRVSGKKEERKKEFASPMDELNYLLDTMERLIDTSMEEYLESIRPPPPEPKAKRTSMLDSLKMLRASRSRSSEELETPTPGTPAKTPNGGTVATTPTSSSFFGNGFRRKERDAKFIPMDEEIVDEFVETVRRIAELVVIGERSLAKHDERRHGDDVMAGAGESEETKYLSIFETFFERQGLATITNVLAGVSFDLKSHPSIVRQLKMQQEKIENPSTPVTKRSASIDVSDKSATSSGPSGEAIVSQEEEDVAVTRPINLDEHEYMLLPPLAIATQAIQSVSILVQNVSRATSLFFILSNNHVNQLINYPLEQYHIAERHKHNQEGNGLSPRRFGSPELAELTTHFVTFLKSLAMRMNTETLQFFLTYPADMPTEDVDDIIVIDSSPSFDNILSNEDDDDEDRPMDETKQTEHAPFPASPRPVSIKTVKVEFPLYERALEFCTAHQDSFVRVTAMNICLNTLRLATVIPIKSEGEVALPDFDIGKSPDGVLHNAKPLPLKERVSIAQYVCTPSRVERLASPIFTKLAQSWGILEEQFREMDSVASSAPASGSSSSKVARAKEKARRSKTSDAFNDTAYSVQDELELLEDVLKVGLTSLNEQVIEMMFATFVYPLLLQPLLLYFQRSPVPDEVLFADPLNDHSAGRQIRDSDLTATEKAIISAPAKSAFFCLAAAFQFLSNPPLLRLLFTALFHPLAPEATGETMIRAKADVACLGPDGKVQIRIDPIDATTGKMKCVSERSTYVFGTITGRKVISNSSHNSGQDETTCVFVLSPALSEILEFRGSDASLVARTRHNPYRKAVFQCFALCSQLSDLRPLSVLAVEAAVSKFSAKFLSDVLFGVDLKTFRDNMPIDERSLDSHWSNVDDRDIGGGTLAGESRLSLGAPSTGRLKLDHMNEVLSAFRSCIMKAAPSGKGTWKLEYDLIAAHALLCVVRGNEKATNDAAIGMDKRCRQAAAFLSDIPESVERFGGEKLSELLKGLDKQKPRDNMKIQGTIMDILFRGYGNLGTSTSVLNDLVEMKSIHTTKNKSGHAVSVATLGTYSSMCNRCTAFSPLDSEQAEGALRTAMGSARAWVKLDAFSTMLNTMVATNSRYVQNKEKLAGFVVKRDGSLVDTDDDKLLYSQISEFFARALLGFDGDDSYVDAKSGSVVSLVGRTAFPCVCEVPPSSSPLFSEAGAKVVSQGITWQSLYLVILGRHFVLAEPDRQSSGDGRVVTRCRLECVLVDRDGADARSDTTARRLIISHDGLDDIAPGLFLFGASPKVKDEGPFIRLTQCRSGLDVWFEDNKAVSMAYKKVGASSDESRAYRGLRVQRYLAQEVGSGYPRDIPLYTKEDSR